MQPTLQERLNEIASLCVRKVSIVDDSDIPPVPAVDSLTAAANADPVAELSSEDQAYEDAEASAEVEKDEQNDVKKSIVVNIAKAVEEQQTVTGVVLQPEVVDGHGDIMSADVIRDTAFKFLAGFNKTTKLGVQHSVFKKGQLELVESFIAPMDMVLGSKTVKGGSWVMTVRVLDKKIWAKVKAGQITGFSIGGIAKVIPVAA